MKKPGYLVCLVNKIGEPFIILRPTSTESYVFCLKDEVVSENNYDGSYCIPKEFYLVVDERDFASVRGKIVSNRCYITPLALEAFEKEYDKPTSTIKGNVKYSTIKPFLKYIEVLIDYGI